MHRDFKENTPHQQVSNLRWEYRLCEAVVTKYDKEYDSLVHGNSARLCVEL